MKTIIAGSREITNPWLVDEAIRTCPWPITELVCGGAQGVDSLGERWAMFHGIPIKYFIPEWRRNGIVNMRAGFERNEKMAVYGEGLIAIWNGRSRGTADMVIRAKEHGLRLHLKLVGQ